ncbi:MAG: hypothetical protein NTV72_00030 [Candidatus Taylorbacteria bacterium]|nr:hypothetical protein [Candidatus Taylorbacteria bacterium]
MKKIVIITISLAFIFAVYLMRPSLGTSTAVATVTEVPTAVKAESNQQTENKPAEAQEKPQQIFGSNTLRFNCRVEIQ